MNEIRKQTGVSRLFMIFIIFHGLYALTPLLRYTHTLIYCDFAIVLCYYWNFRHLMHKGHVINRSISQAYALITVITVITLIYRVVGYSSASYGTCVAYLSLFMSIIFGWYVTKYASITQQRIIFWAYSIIILINVIYNIYILQVVLAGVAIESLNETVSIYRIPNVGSTSFTAYTFFACLCFLICFLHSRDFFQKLITGLLFAVCIYYVIFCSMRGTTAMLFVIAFLLLTTDRFFKGSHAQKNVNFIIILIFGLIYIFKEPFFQLLIEYAPNERLAARFQDVLATTSSGVSDDSFTGRGTLFKISFNSWLNTSFTFLFGIGEPLMGDNNYAQAGISGHSDMVDQLAKYGIVGSFLFIRCLYLGYKYLKKEYLHTEQINPVKYMLLCFVAYGTIKIMYTDDCFLVMFVLFPIVLNFLRNNIKVV